VVGLYAVIFENSSLKIFGKKPLEFTQSATTTSLAYDFLLVFYSNSIRYDHIFVENQDFSRATLRYRHLVACVQT